MATEQQTWEMACHRIGLHQATYPQHPPIGDPAACMAMLEWLISQDQISIERGADKRFVYMERYDDPKMRIKEKILALALALAAAVVALPKEL